MSAHEFEFVRGKTKKFWNIELSARSYTIHFGRKGTAGQKRTKEFPSPAKATLACVKSILKKLEEGYVEVRRPAGGREQLRLKALPKAGDLLRHAIETCSKQQLKFLLENGADPNDGRRGTTPLATAVFYKSAEMVRLLLERGADPKGKDWVGRPLLFLAGECDYGKPNQAVIDLLIQYGAVKDLNADLYLEGVKRVIVKINRNPRLVEELDDPVEFMTNAIEKKSPELVKLLLDLGIDPNAHGSRKTAPLRMAVWMNSSRMVQLLLEHGADVNPKDAKPKSLLAAARGLHECRVISAGGRVLKRWENRQRPKIMELLVRHGARE